MIRIDAPAKVNLRLRVLAREAGGYHSLETLFCAISLRDEITVAPAASGISLRIDGRAPTADAEDNLVVRAARACLREMERGGGSEDAGDAGEAGEAGEAGRRGRGVAAGGLEIGLVKRIPAAAGLGGGSSDAAATLRALDALHGGIEVDVLLRLAAELGSDVPFFLCGSPLAWAWSRGENLLALPPLPARPVLVAHPRVDWPTADAFRRLAELRGPDHRPEPIAVDLRDLADWEGVARLARNDFEAPAVEAVPAIGEGIRALRGAGARVAMLAGSGASVFGVFDSPAARDRAEPGLAALGFDTWAAETLEAVPAPRA